MLAAAAEVPNGRGRARMKVVRTRARPRRPLLRRRRPPARAMYRSLPIPARHVSVPALGQNPPSALGLDPLPLLFRHPLALGDQVRGLARRLWRRTGGVPPLLRVAAPPCHAVTPSAPMGGNLSLGWRGLPHATWPAELGRQGGGGGVVPPRPPQRGGWGGWGCPPRAVRNYLTDPVMEHNQTPALRPRLVYTGSFRFFDRTALDSEGLPWPSLGASSSRVRARAAPP